MRFDSSVLTGHVVCTLARMSTSRWAGREKSLDAEECVEWSEHADRDRKRSVNHFTQGQLALRFGPADVFLV